MGNQSSHANIAWSVSLLRSSLPTETRRGAVSIAQVCVNITAGAPPPRSRRHRRRSRRLLRRHRLTDSERGERDEVFGLLADRLPLLIRLLCNIVRDDRTEAAAIDAVLAAMDALGAIGALFKYAEDKDVSVEILSDMASPLRKRVLPALITRFWDRDLRVVAGARVALEKIIRVTVVQRSPWISVVNASMAFRVSGSEPALRVLLVSLSRLVHFIFCDAVRNADRNKDEWNRRRESTLLGRTSFPRKSGSRTLPEDMAIRRASRESGRRHTSRTSAGTRDELPRGQQIPAFDRRRSTYTSHNQRAKIYLERDMQAAMNVFTALLGIGTSKSPALRKVVVNDLRTVFSSALDGSRAFSAALDQKMYREVALVVLEHYGKEIFHAVLNVMFTRSESGGYIPLKSCGRQTAKVCTKLITMLLREVPRVCSPRIGILTGSCSKAIKAMSERSTELNPRRRSELLSVASGAVKLLSSAIPGDQYEGLNVTGSDPTMFSATIESCMKSIAFIGAKFARIDLSVDREITMTGLLDCLRTWLALGRIGQKGLLWAKGPTYCSAIAFLASVARRAAKASHFGVGASEGTSPDSADVGMTFAPPRAGTEPTNIVSRSVNSSMIRRLRTFSMYGDVAIMVGLFESCAVLLIREASCLNVAKDLYRTIVFEYARSLRPGRFTGTSVAALTGFSKQHDSDEIQALFAGESHAHGVTNGFSLSDDEGGGFSPSARRRDPQRRAASQRDSKTVDDGSSNFVLESCLLNDGLRIAKYREMSVDALPHTVGTWFIGSLPPPFDGDNNVEKDEGDSFGIVGSNLGPPMTTSLSATSRPKMVDPRTFFEIARCLSLVVRLTVDETESDDDRKSAIEWIINDVRDAKSRFLSRVFEESLAIGGLKAQQSRQSQTQYGMRDSDRASNIVLKETSAMLAEMKLLRVEVAELRSSLMRMEEREGRELTRRLTSQGALRSRRSTGRSSSTKFSRDTDVPQVSERTPRRRGICGLFLGGCC